MKVFLSHTKLLLPLLVATAVHATENVACRSVKRKYCLDKLKLRNDKCDQLVEAWCTPADGAQPYSKDCESIKLNYCLETLQFDEEECKPIVASWCDTTIALQLDNDCEGDLMTHCLETLEQPPEVCDEKVSIWCATLPELCVDKKTEWCLEHKNTLSEKECRQQAEIWCLPH